MQKYISILCLVMLYVFPLRADLKSELATLATALTQLDTMLTPATTPDDEQKRKEEEEKRKQEEEEKRKQEEEEKRKEEEERKKEEEERRREEEETTFSAGFQAKADAAYTFAKNAPDKSSADKIIAYLKQENKYPDPVTGLDQQYLACKIGSLVEGS